MNMIEAAKETLAKAEAAGMDILTSDIPELDYPHLQLMLSRMQVNEMSEAKIGRWLGWMQAAVVAADIGLGLEDMKEINKKWAD